LERLHDRLDTTWGVVEHLMSVKNSEPLRRAHEKVEPEVVRFTIRLGQSEAIFQGLTALRDDEGWAQLDNAQKRIVEKLIQKMELAGVGLEGKQRERFNQIKLELADLSTRFGNHLLDATKAFALTLRDPEEVAGLPRSHMELAAQSARAAGEAGATAEKGPWRITLDGPSYLGFMQHSRRRDLREKLYRANITKASSGDLDNTPLIKRILGLRCEEASLLGFGDYAELSLSTKMAADVAAVERLLEELRLASFEAAKREHEELREFMRKHGAPESDDPQHWDIPFWSERLREERFDYSEEETRPYFPMPRVLEGLFALAERLFQVKIVPADGETSVWHEDVRFFRVYGENGEAVAAFYLDPYSRPEEKRGGAWMNEVLGRSRLFAPEGKPARLPVAYVVCNGAPPVDGKPSLMTFREIETLFHEFGHTLQHLLTRVDYGLASGIRNIEWDAVELPSQFMENWCYHRETLLGLTSHVDTGEPLPEETFEKIRAARTHRAGSLMLRQLYFGFADLELHHCFDPDREGTPFEVQRRVAEKSTILPPLPEDRFLCSFAHIFQGSYAAGYYSYKWAEVLSADAFAAFEEAGLEDQNALVETGRRYRDTVLALGGSRAPMEVFKQFRRREPSTGPLLRQSGLEPKTG
ncbi:MAG: M3 family metallopeptidase, partial [Acidobacteriota bacterium]